MQSLSLCLAQSALGQTALLATGCLLLMYSGRLSKSTPFFYGAATFLGTALLLLLLFRRIALALGVDQRIMAMFSLTVSFFMVLFPEWLRTIVDAVWADSALLHRTMIAGIKNAYLLLGIVAAVLLGSFAFAYWMGPPAPRTRDILDWMLWGLGALLVTFATWSTPLVGVGIVGLVHIATLLPLLRQMRTLALGVLFVVAVEALISRLVPFHPVLLDPILQPPVSTPVLSMLLLTCAFLWHFFPTPFAPLLMLPVVLAEVGLMFFQYTIVLQGLSFIGISFVLAIMFSSNARQLLGLVPQPPALITAEEYDEQGKICTKEALAEMQIFLNTSSSQDFVRVLNKLTPHAMKAVVGMLADRVSAEDHRDWIRTGSLDFSQQEERLLSDDEDHGELSPGARQSDSSVPPGTPLTSSTNSVPCQTRTEHSTLGSVDGTDGQAAHNPTSNGLFPVLSAQPASPWVPSFQRPRRQPQYGLHIDENSSPQQKAQQNVGLSSQKQTPTHHSSDWGTPSRLPNTPILSTFCNSPSCTSITVNNRHAYATTNKSLRPARELSLQELRAEFRQRGMTLPIEEAVCKARLG